MNNTDEVKGLPRRGFPVMSLAYIRQGKLTYTDEAVILACLVHTKGRGRESKDMEDLRKIMRDQNLKLKKEN